MLKWVIGVWLLRAHPNPSRILSSDGKNENGKKLVLLNVEYLFVNHIIPTFVIVST